MGRPTQAQQNTDYPKPIVTQATNDVLDPLLASPSGITVDVAYTGMLNTDLIGFSFNGDESYEPMNGSLFQKVTFKVSMAAVAAAIGSTVEVKYVVVKSTGAFFSEILNLVVQPIPTSALPTPQITQASAGKLDVNTLSADPEVTVAPWPLIGVGQQLWLRLESSSNQDIWQAFPITDTRTQSTTIPLEYLQGLGEGSELRLVLEVSFNNDATRQAFPLQSYQLVSEGPGGGEVTEDFESYSSGDKPLIFDTTHMIFKGPHQSLTLHPAPRKMVYQVNFLIGTDKLEIALKSDYSKIIFEAYINAGNTLTVICEHEGGVEEQRINSLTWKDYTFEHPGIKAFEIRGSYPTCVLRLNDFRLSK